MKILILGAGYGTRLVHDIDADGSAEYVAIRHLPKPLLPVGGVPLLTRWLNELKTLDDVDPIYDLYVVCNQHNYKMFYQWFQEKGITMDHLWNDGTTSNATRLGAIVDIDKAIKQFQIKDDLMIIGGDTLFYPEFKLKKCIKQFAGGEKKSWFGRLCGKHTKQSVPVEVQVLWYKCTDDECLKSGILETDLSGRVTDFLEKPDPSTTKFRMACPCFYLIKAHVLPLISVYIDEFGHNRDSVDAPGKLLSWIHKKVYTGVYEIEGRFDIGGLPTYKQANDYFLNQENKKL